jgi:hypothetical protein
MKMKRERRNKKSEVAFYKDLKKAIDEGHKYFWRKRGLVTPPATEYNTDFKKTGRKVR